MIGLLIILLVSWLLLKYIEKENLTVLGYTPTLKRLGQFAIGLGFITILKLLFIYIDTQVNTISWRLLPEFYWENVVSSFWYHLKSALTEDLVFRGALLYILIKRIGMQKALLVSALVFGVYHWFSYGILGSRVVLMVYVLVSTGLTGYVWAYTFAKTKSIMMPLGFHFGWNYIFTFFYQGGPYGNIVFDYEGITSLAEPYHTYYSIGTALAPTLLTWIFVKVYLTYQKPTK